MSQLKPIDLAEATYSAGTRQLPPNPTGANVDVGYQQFLLSLTRVGWPVNGGAVILTIRVELSFDGGSTWPHFAELQAKGGNLVFNSTGLPITATTLRFIMPQPSNPNRKIRIVETNTVSITTAISLTIDDTAFSLQSSPFPEIA